MAIRKLYRAALHRSVHMPGIFRRVFAHPFDAPVRQSRNRGLRHPAQDPLSAPL